jgi:hypothetical protein
MRAYIIALALCCAACGGPEFTLTQESAQLAIPLPQSESEGGEFGEGGADHDANTDANQDSMGDSASVDAVSNDVFPFDAASDVLDAIAIDSSVDSGVSCLRNSTLDLGCETYFPGMLRGYTCVPDSYVAPGCAVRADNNPGDRCCQ